MLPKAEKEDTKEDTVEATTPTPRTTLTTPQDYYNQEMKWTRCSVTMVVKSYMKTCGKLLMPMDLKTSFSDQLGHGEGTTR